MTKRKSMLIAAACLLVTAGPVVAQTSSGDVTFKIPLNLTQLSSDIAKIQLSCSIKSAAIPGGQSVKGTPAPGVLGKQDEIPVSGGQLVMTATIVVPVSGLDNPVGKTATYDCRFVGFSTSLQRWDVFSETQSVAAFRLSPTPNPIQGSFVW